MAAMRLFYRWVPHVLSKKYFNFDNLKCQFSGNGKNILTNFNQERIISTYINMLICVSFFNSSYNELFFDTMFFLRY